MHSAIQQNSVGNGRQADPGTAFEAVLTALRIEHDNSWCILNLRTTVFNFVLFSHFSLLFFSDTLRTMSLFRSVPWIMKIQLVVKMTNLIQSVIPSQAADTYFYTSFPITPKVLWKLKMKRTENSSSSHFPSTSLSLASYTWDVFRGECF